MEEGLPPFFLITPVATMCLIPGGWYQDWSNRRWGGGILITFAGILFLRVSVLTRYSRPTAWPNAQMKCHFPSPAGLNWCVTTFLFSVWFELPFPLSSSFCQHFITLTVQESKQANAEVMELYCWKRKRHTIYKTAESSSVSSLQFFVKWVGVVSGFNSSCCWFFI